MDVFLSGCLPCGPAGGLKAVWQTAQLENLKDF
jgi:hypothetical protein